MRIKEKCLRAGVAVALVTAFLFSMTGCSKKVELTAEKLKEAAVKAGCEDVGKADEIDFGNLGDGVVYMGDASDMSGINAVNIGKTIDLEKVGDETAVMLRDNKDESDTIMSSICLFEFEKERYAKDAYDDICERFETTSREFERTDSSARIELEEDKDGDVVYCIFNASKVDYRTFNYGVYRQGNNLLVIYEVINGWGYSGKDYKEYDGGFKLLSSEICNELGVKPPYDANR